MKKTATCRCGKIDIEIIDDKIYCPVCKITIRSPIPDDFKGQQKLTDFYSLIRNKSKIKQT